MSVQNSEKCSWRISIPLWSMLFHSCFIFHRVQNLCNLLWLWWNSNISMTNKIYVLLILEKGLLECHLFYACMGVYVCQSYPRITLERFYQFSQTIVWKPCQWRKCLQYLLGMSVGGSVWCIIEGFQLVLILLQWQLELIQFITVYFLYKYDILHITTHFFIKNL
jgi:hypothetical protein